MRVAPCYASDMTSVAVEIMIMAFHNPNPKIQKLEQRNARLRAELFARLFGGAWRGIRKGARRLSRGRFRHRRQPNLRSGASRSERRWHRACHDLVPTACLRFISRNRRVGPIDGFRNGCRLYLKTTDTERFVQGFTDDCHGVASTLMTPARTSRRSTHAASLQASHS